MGDVLNNLMTYLKSIIALVGLRSKDIFEFHVITAPLADSPMVKHYGNNKTEATGIKIAVEEF